MDFTWLVHAILFCNGTFFFPLYVYVCIIDVHLCTAHIMFDGSVLTDILCAQIIFIQIRTNIHPVTIYPYSKTYTIKHNLILLNVCCQSSFFQISICWQYKLTRCTRRCWQWSYNRCWTTITDNTGSCCCIIIVTCCIMVWRWCWRCGWICRAWWW